MMDPLDQFEKIWAVDFTTPSLSRERKARSTSQYVSRARLWLKPAPSFSTGSDCARTLRYFDTRSGFQIPEATGCGHWLAT